MLSVHRRNPVACRAPRWWLPGTRAWRGESPHADTPYLIDDRTVTHVDRVSPSSDAECCARITCTQARTFTFASRFLPTEKRRAAFAVYAFCRVADDLVDEAASHPLGEVAHALATYRHLLVEALAGRPSGPIFRELSWAVARFGIPDVPLYELVAAVTRDLVPQSYGTWEDLAEYCRGVASTVGEICAHLFGVPDSAHARHRALEYARTLGIAMQLTNILRDVGEDAARGRCYLPVEDLSAFGLSTEQILTGTLDATDVRWRALMTFEVGRARALYEAASPGIPMVAADAQRCALLCADGYAAILGAIKRNGYDTLTRRARAGRLARVGLLWGVWRATRHPMRRYAAPRTIGVRCPAPLAPGRESRMGEVPGWAQQISR